MGWAEGYRNMNRRSLASNKRHSACQERFGNLPTQEDSAQQEKKERKRDPLFKSTAEHAVVI